MEAVLIGTDFLAKCDYRIGFLGELNEKLYGK
jgi:hypothetical protein